MPYRFGRPLTSHDRLPSLLDEAGRMRAFVPPFRFTSFFSPEDTLLCAIAAEAALSHARTAHRFDGRKIDPLRIVELTTGSGLVGLHLLRLENDSRLLGLDIDEGAVKTANGNANILGLLSRSSFLCADMWSESTKQSLAAYKPHLLICNPPYIPEPKGLPLEREAGSGHDGTAHLMETIALAAKVQPRAMALSWCSLSDPAAVIRQAAHAGYSLNSLFIVAIADGEYSGSVHSYLRTLPHAWLNEESSTRQALAPDGAARFGYLLMAGDFSLQDDIDSRTESAVARICEAFADDGLSALENPEAPIPVRTWILDRWDEVRLRASLHGEIGGQPAA